MAPASARPPARAGVVLCGGLSSRMGRPKAWLPWFGGRTLVEHVVDRLGEAVDEVVVVTSAALDLPPLPARIVRDREPERGPLAGIRDGLAAARAPMAFVTSTDAPFLTPAHVDALFDRAEAAGGSELDGEDAAGRACAPVAEGHVQVLSAVYPTAAYERAERLLAEGARRPLDLLEALDFRAVDAKTGDDDGPAPWHGFNTPSAYLEAVRAIDPEASAELELLGRSALRSDTTRLRVPVGTLGECLARLPEALGLVEAGRVARPFLVSLGGRQVVRDLGIPVGPGERISVLDAQAGG